MSALHPRQNVAPAIVPGDHGVAYRGRFANGLKIVVTVVSMIAGIIFIAVAAVAVTSHQPVVTVVGIIGIGIIGMIRPTPLAPYRGASGPVVFFAASLACYQW